MVPSSEGALEKPNTKVFRMYAHDDDMVIISSGEFFKVLGEMMQLDTHKVTLSEPFVPGSIFGHQTLLE